MKTVYSLFICIIIFYVPDLQAQFPNANANKSPGNNYEHAPNTIVRTAEDTLVVHIKGSGSRPVILITDYMQDESMYDDLVERHKAEGQFHIAIPAGMGGTPAYHWPVQAENFVSRPWTATFEDELIEYIELKSLDKPLVVATWPTGMNAALHLAKNHADKIGGLLIIGQSQRTPYFRAYPYNSLDPGVFDIDKQRTAVEGFIAFWKTVDTHTWFSNSWRPSFYSNDKELGLNTAYKRAFHEIPVMIRYWSEYIITDLSKVIPDISIPIRVITTIQSEERMQQLLDRNGMSTMKADEVLGSFRTFTKQDWTAEKENIQIDFFEDSGLFVWHDKPRQFDAAFIDFLKTTNH